MFQFEIVQVMIVGDCCFYMVVLIVFDFDWIQEWCVVNGDVCCVVVFVENSEYCIVIGYVIECVNKDLLVIECVCCFVLVDDLFIIENEQLMLSLKICWYVLKQVYGEWLDVLYKV